MQGYGIDTTEHRLFNANKAASMALQHTTIGNGGEGRSGIAFSLSIPIQPNDESCPQLSEEQSQRL
jgi:hypothetical protein